MDGDLENANREGLVGYIKELLGDIAALEARVAELEAQNEQLRQQLGKKQPPHWAKPNRPQPSEPRFLRRKRAPEHNRGRRREEPTRIEYHALEHCPECSYRLRGESVDYVRQVVEIPEPAPVEVVEHRVLKRYCPHCEQWRSPKLDLVGQVLGQGRMGVRLISLIAYLRNGRRYTIEAIQEYLRTIHRLSIARGEVVELLHQVRRSQEPAVEGLKEQARASPILHGDETGWRENGRNGYIWGFFTPEGVRYYEYDRSRGQVVPKRILGGKVAGHLVTDFYASYNDIVGNHQRCWAHLLRDLHDLKEAHPQEEEVLGWAGAVRKLYDEAQDWLQANPEPRSEEREGKYVGLVERIHQLGLQYAQVKHPCRALAKRILRHEPELFQFVLVAGLSANNNLAERSLRPLVVIRKISGGSRSDEGTKTRMALASLFETWRAQGLNSFVECFKLLSQPSPAPT